MKTKLIKFFNLIKKDKQAKILTIMGIILLFIFTLGFSLSMFTTNRNNKVANIKINDLSFNITTNSGETNDRILHLQAGKIEQFNIILTNLNKIDVKYEFTYELCNNQNCTETSNNIPSDISVSKEYESSEVSATINSNKTKSLTILTNNKSNNDYYIKLNLNAGYIWNDLELANQIKYVKGINKDIDIVAYVDGVEKQDLPSTCFYSAVSTAYKNNTELKDSNVSFTCNYATGKWDINVSNLDNIPNKLIVNFESKGINAVEYVSKVQELDSNNKHGLRKDPTADENIRYTGAEPRNYVQFGNDGELWRIIGIFNVKDKETGSTTKKIKIVRNDSLGSFSWDARYNNQYNQYYGINDWNTADLQKELNGDYLNYNLTSNTNWYNSYLDGNIPVQSQTGVFNYNYTIKEKYQNYISESVWNTGGNEYTYVNSAATLPTLGQYNAERGNKFYTADTANNVTRTATWTGKVGLIYASDFGYASNDEECQNDLRAGQVYDASTGNYDYTNVKCKNDNWLHKSQWYWTLSPYSSGSPFAFIVGGGGVVYYSDAFNSYEVRPSVYLKSNILIIGGDGSSLNPYILG